MPLPTVSGRVLQLLLEYLYTGSCQYPRDDLNLGLDLMAIADQFLLDTMKSQCEGHLSSKIDPEVTRAQEGAARILKFKSPSPPPPHFQVVIPLYYAAVRFNATRLLANSSHFLLKHYCEVEDADHQVLLHLLETGTQQPQL